MGETQGKALEGAQCQGVQGCARWFKVLAAGGGALANVQTGRRLAGAPSRYLGPRHRTQAQDTAHRTQGAKTIGTGIDNEEEILRSIITRKKEKEPFSDAPCFVALTHCRRGGWEPL